MKKPNQKLKAFVVIGGFLFVCFSFYIYQIIFTPNILIDEGDSSTELLIPTGATIKTVKDSLDQKELIHDKKSFYFLTRLLGYNTKIKPGRYLIPKKSSNLQVIKKLKNGIQDPVKITFNNIRLKSDLAQKLGAKLEPSSSQIDSALRDTMLANIYGFDTTTIMAMFIPDTYEMYWNTPVRKLMDRMSNEYKKFWSDERLKRAEELGLNPIQVSIVASIVEAETQQKSEKARIAGVYLNRLKMDMPLQADPTVKFALGDFSIRRILEGHTQCESPYNTYKNKGLPPGPINLPSVVSIDAVLNAEKHDYLFFCASPINPGFHDFSVSYRDHVNNANKYRKHLDVRKIR